MILNFAGCMFAAHSRSQVSDAVLRTRKELKTRKTLSWKTLHSQSGWKLKVKAYRRDFLHLLDPEKVDNKPRKYGDLA